MKRRLLHNWLHLGIVPVPPGMVPSGPSDFSLQALTRNTNAYAEGATTIVTAGTNVTLTTAQVLAKNIVLTAGASGAFTITLPSTTSILDALGPTMPLDGSFFFELSLWNNATGQAGTLTPGDASTTLPLSDNALPTDTTCKWMVRVNPIVSSALGRPTTLTITKTSTAIAVGTAGSGTVTSVAQTVPVEFTISGSPVTTTGTLAIGKATELANTVWAGPTSGGAAQPTFRALVPSDIPGGTGGISSITATNPIVVTPDPITTTGTVSHNTSGVSAATYGDATHVAQVTVNATGHVTSASSIAISGGGSVTSITATTPIVVTPDPITGAGTVSHATSGIAAGTYGTSSKVPRLTFNATGHATAVSEQDIIIFGGSINLTMLGAGGGGGSTAGAGEGGGGGGAGESCDGLEIAVTPGGSYAYSIGTGGAADTDGGNTTFSTFTALGGKKGSNGATRTGGAGGGALGAAGASAAVDGRLGSPEHKCWFGGSSGGGGQSGAGSSGNGGGSGGFFTGGLSNSNASGSGGGGAASIYDKGGTGGGGANGGAASGFGSGGGGAGGGGHTGGPGSGGYLLITWPGGSAEFTSGSGTWVAPT